MVSLILVSALKYTASTLGGSVEIGNVQRWIRVIKQNKSLIFWPTCNLNCISKNLLLIFLKLGRKPLHRRNSGTRHVEEPSSSSCYRLSDMSLWMRRFIVPTWCCISHAVFFVGAELGMSAYRGWLVSSELFLVAECKTNKSPKEKRKISRRRKQTWNKLRNKNKNERSRQIKERKML